MDWEWSPRLTAEWLRTMLRRPIAIVARAVDEEGRRSVHAAPRAAREVALQPVRVEVARDRLLTEAPSTPASFA